MAKKTTVLAALIALSAFVIRIARLDYVSLRGDESFSVTVARWDLGRLFELLATGEPHPPLYYTALHFWMRVAGDSEFAVRFLSVAFGVLVVPATFAFGRALIGRARAGGTPALPGPGAQASRLPVAGAALLASFFVAINPFLLWHSQDARSYTMLSFFTTASILLSLVDLSQRWKWVGYVAVTYAAMLTHYSALYVVLVENVVAMMFLLRGRGGWLAPARRWVTSQALLAVAYLPWVWWARRPFTAHSADWVQPVDVWASLERTLVALGTGTTVGPASRSAVFAIVGLALLFAFVGVLRTASWRWAFAVGAFYLAAPTLLLYALSLWRPMFDERHLVIVVSAFAVVAALGAARLAAWPWPGIALATVLIGALAVLSLGNYFFDPQFAKSPGWRALVREIRQGERAGDYILLNYPDPTFWYYYRGNTPLGMLPAKMPLDRAEIERSLANLASTYRRIWAVPGANAAWDADGVVEEWLVGHLRKVREESFGGVRVALFSTE